MRLIPVKRAFHHHRTYPNAFALYYKSAHCTFPWSTATTTRAVSIANLSSQPLRIKYMDNNDDREEKNTAANDNKPVDKLVFYANRKLEPWKNLLGLAARAAWRVAPAKPSPALEAAQNYVLEEKGNKRSLKVLRRTLEDMMKSHRSLADRRDRERRMVLSLSGDMQQSRKRDAKVQPILYGPNEVMAAFKFRLFPNYTIVKRVLEEVQSLLGPDSFQPKKVIDFGIGCGSASAAAADIWPGIQWIHGIDPSLTMREGAEAFLKEYHRIMKEQGDGDEEEEEDEEEEDEENKDEEEEDEEEEEENIAAPTPSARLTFSAHLSAEANTSNTFDLALFVYTATELPQNASTLAAAALLWEKLSPGGLFVMIEPGTPDGFSSVRSVRNMLLDCCTTSIQDDANETDDDEQEAKSEERSPRHSEECYIIAPCTHSGPCPMDRFKQYSRKQTQVDVTKTQARKEGEEADIEGFANLDNQEEDDNDDEDDDTERGDEDSDEVAADNDDDDNDDDANESNDDDDMTRSGYCSFVQSMPGKSGLGKGEKFSYLVAQKRSIEPSFQSAFPSFEDVDVTKLLKDALAHKPTLDDAIALEQRYIESEEDDLGLELIRGDKQRFGRIVNAPKKKKSHVLIDSCEAPGRIVRHIISKRKASVAPGLYAAARASRWGGYWPSTTTRYGK